MNKKTMGAILAIIGSFTFVLADISNRAGVKTVNPIWGAAVWCLASAPILGVIPLLTKNKICFPRKFTMKFIIILLLTAVFDFGLVLGLKYAGVAVTATLLSLTILITPLFAKVILKERMSKAHFISLIIAIIGVIVLTYGQNQLPLEPTWLLGITIMFACVLSAGIKDCLTKQLLTKGINYSSILFLVGVIGIPSYVLPSIFVSITFDLTLIWPFILAGIISGFGYTLIVKSWTYTNISILVPLGMIVQPLSATILAWVLLNEQLSIITITGIIIVCFSFIFLMKELNKR